MVWIGENFYATKIVNSASTGEYDMAKMVKTAQGMMIDWDLLKIQSQVNGSVADQVEIVDHAAVAARRAQRTKLAAAKKLLEEAQRSAAEAAGAEDVPQQTQRAAKKN